MQLFPNYHEWRTAITERCGLTLTGDYCTERCAALNDLSITSTKSFVDAYGEDYRDQVVQWFEKARTEATQ